MDSPFKWKHTEPSHTDPSQNTIKIGATRINAAKKNLKNVREKLEETGDHSGITHIDETRKLKDVGLKEVGHEHMPPEKTSSEKVRSSSEGAGIKATKHETLETKGRSQSVDKVMRVVRESKPPPSYSPPLTRPDLRLKQNRMMPPPLPTVPAPPAQNQPLAPSPNAGRRLPVPPGSKPPTSITAAPRTITSESDSPRPLARQNLAPTSTTTATTTTSTQASQPSSSPPQRPPLATPTPQNTPTAIHRTSPSLPPQINKPGTELKRKPSQRNIVSPLSKEPVATSKSTTAPVNTQTPPPRPATPSPLFSAPPLDNPPPLPFSAVKPGIQSTRVQEAKMGEPDGKYEEQDQNIPSSIPQILHHIKVTSDKLKNINENGKLQHFHMKKDPKTQSLIQGFSRQANEEIQSNNAEIKKLMDEAKSVISKLPKPAQDKLMALKKEMDGLMGAQHQHDKVLSVLGDQKTSLLQKHGEDKKSVKKKEIIKLDKQIESEQKLRREVNERFILVQNVINAILDPLGDANSVAFTDKQTRIQQLQQRNNELIGIQEVIQQYPEKLQKILAADPNKFNQKIENQIETNAQMFVFIKEKILGFAAAMPSKDKESTDKKLQPLLLKLEKLGVLYEEKIMKAQSKFQYGQLEALIGAWKPKHKAEGFEPEFAQVDQPISDANMDAAFKKIMGSLEGAAGEFITDDFHKNFFNPFLISQPGLESLIKSGSMGGSFSPEQAKQNLDCFKKYCDVKKLNPVIGERLASMYNELYEESKKTGSGSKNYLERMDAFLGMLNDPVGFLRSEPAKIMGEILANANLSLTEQWTSVKLKQKVDALVTSIEGRAAVTKEGLEVFKKDLKVLANHLDTAANKDEKNNATQALRAYLVDLAQSYNTFFRIEY